MLIKIIGALAAIASSAAIGIYFSGRLGFRSDDLYEMKRALAILKSEIEYSFSPLPEAMRNISMKCAGNVRISALFEKAAILMEDGGETAYSAWEKAIGEFENSYLEAEDIENIRSIGQTLGYIDRNLQIAGIDMLIDYIDVKCAELNELNIKNKRLYINLGVMAGLAVTIVLF